MHSVAPGRLPRKELRLSDVGSGEWQLALALLSTMANSDVDSGEWQLAVALLSTIANVYVGSGECAMAPTTPAMGVSNRSINLLQTQGLGRLAMQRDARIASDKHNDGKEG